MLMWLRTSIIMITIYQHNQEKNIIDSIELIYQKTYLVSTTDILRLIWWCSNDTQSVFLFHVRVVFICWTTIEKFENILF